MPVLKGKIVNNEIIFFARVGIAGDLRSEENTKLFLALLDTGASRTMISQKVVNEVGLVSDEYMSVVPVSGEPITVKKYKIGIDIPIVENVALPGGNSAKQATLKGKDMEVGLLPHDYKTTNHDILLGMDFLYGFHFTVYEDMFIFSS